MPLSVCKITGHGAASTKVCCRCGAGVYGLRTKAVTSPVVKESRHHGPILRNFAPKSIIPDKRYLSHITETFRKHKCHAQKEQVLLINLARVIQNIANTSHAVRNLPVGNIIYCTAKHAFMQHRLPSGMPSPSDPSWLCPKSDTAFLARSYERLTPASLETRFKLSERDIPCQVVFQPDPLSELAKLPC